MKEINIKDIKAAVWLEDPTKFPYVRQNICISTNRKPNKLRKGYKLIGYIKPNYALNQGIRLFEVTMFWLAIYDRGMPKECELFKSIVPYKAIKIVR